jgi:hypothetical protein
MQGQGRRIRPIDPARLCLLESLWWIVCMYGRWRDHGQVRDPGPLTSSQTEGASAPTLDLLPLMVQLEHRLIVSLLFPLNHADWQC